MDGGAEGDLSGGWGKGMPDLRLFGQLSWGKPCEH